MAVAMLPANLVARAKQFADEQLAVYAHLISENESLDDALALGVLTSREATLAQPVQRLAMCRDRCLCLELGQALMTKGLHTAAIDVLRTAADAFADALIPLRHARSCTRTTSDVGQLIQDGPPHRVRTHLVLTATRAGDPQWPGIRAQGPAVARSRIPVSYTHLRAPRD